MSEPAIPCSARRRRQIERAFLGRLSARGWDRLRAHLLDCEGCRGHYDRLARADRAAESATQLSPRSHDRIAAAVVASAASAKPTRRIWLAVPTFAALSTAAAALLWLSTPTGTGEYRARGSSTPFAGRSPGLTAFCVTASVSRAGSEHGARVSDHASAARMDAPTPSLSCRTSDQLQLAYTAPNEPGLFLVVFGTENDGDTHLYAPRASDATAVALESGAVDAPLPWSTRLSVKHHPGTVDLIARFFDSPVTAGEAQSVRPVLELRISVLIQEGPVDAH